MLSHLSNHCYSAVSCLPPDFSCIIIDKEIKGACLDSYNGGNTCLLSNQRNRIIPQHWNEPFQTILGWAEEKWTVECSYWRQKIKLLLRNQITSLINGIQPFHVAFSENPIHTTHTRDHTTEFQLPSPRNRGPCSDFSDPSPCYWANWERPALQSALDDQAGRWQWQFNNDNHSGQAPQMLKWAMIVYRGINWDL